MINYFLTVLLLKNEFTNFGDICSLGLSFAWKNKDVMSIAHIYRLSAFANFYGDFKEKQK